MMSKSYITKIVGSTLSIIIAIFFVTNLISIRVALAAVSSVPIVSIGVGNGNIPSNTAPIHGSVYTGSVPVYATITDADNDLWNYHFRVIKDGGAQGHTCNDLFAFQNQGYASTTLGHTACGFNFNQSVYMSPRGFTNTIIATLNARDLVAFGGEGNYWLVLGAVDFAGNRVSPNYLNDPKIEITVSLTMPVSPATTTEATTTDATGTDTASTSPTTTPSTPSSGGQSATGYHGGGSYFAARAAQNPTASTVSAVPIPFLPTAVVSDVLSAKGLAAAEMTSSDATSSGFATVASSTNPAQSLGASVGLLGLVQNIWLWLAILIVVAVLAAYFYTR